MQKPRVDLRRIWNGWFFFRLALPACLLAGMAWGVEYWQTREMEQERISEKAEIVATQLDQRLSGVKAVLQQMASQSEIVDIKSNPVEAGLMVSYLRQMPSVSAAYRLDDRSEIMIRVPFDGELQGKNLDAISPIYRRSLMSSTPVFSSPIQQRDQWVLTAAIGMKQGETPSGVLAIDMPIAGLLSGITDPRAILIDGEGRSFNRSTVAPLSPEWKSWLSSQGTWPPTQKITTQFEGSEWVIIPLNQSSWALAWPVSESPLWWRGLPILGVLFLALFLAFFSGRSRFQHSLIQPLGFVAHRLSSNGTGEAPNHVPFEIASLLRAAESGGRIWERSLAEERALRRLWAQLSECFEPTHLGALLNRVVQFSIQSLHAQKAVIFQLQRDQLVMLAAQGTDERFMQAWRENLPALGLPYSLVTLQAMTQKIGLPWSLSPQDIERDNPWSSWFIGSGGYWIPLSSTSDTPCFLYIQGINVPGLSEDELHNLIKAMALQLCWSMQGHAKALL